MSLFLDTQLTEELTGDYMELTATRLQPGQIWRTLLSETIISFHLLYMYVYICKNVFLK